MKSLLQHSCGRNVGIIFYNGFVAGIVLRPIKKDEVLQYSLAEPLPDNYYKKRSAMFLAKHEHHCICDFCHGWLKKTSYKHFDFPPNRRWSSNQDFQYIEKHITEPGMESYTAEEAQILKAKCESFLTQSGGDNWCHEINLAVSVYQSLLRAGAH